MDGVESSFVLGDVKVNFKYGCFGSELSFGLAGNYEYDARLYPQSGEDQNKIRKRLKSFSKKELIEFMIEFLVNFEED